MKLGRDRLCHRLRFYSYIYNKELPWPMRGYASVQSFRRWEMRMAQKLGPHMVQNSPFS